MTVISFFFFTLIPAMQHAVFVDGYGAYSNSVAALSTSSFACTFRTVAVPNILFLIQGGRAIWHEGTASAGNSTTRLPHSKPIAHAFIRSECMFPWSRPASPGLVKDRPVGMVMSACEGPHIPLLRSPLSSIASVNCRAQDELD
ncbi:hypothetical protein F5146DRAFT_624999 [Armillaria mellea]|nr:hypothetical protein F5146DRAFT_624999 [Armillaria mellea]